MVYEQSGIPQQKDILTQGRSSRSGLSVDPPRSCDLTREMSDYQTRFDRRTRTFLIRIDVEKSASHQQSQAEIGSDNPCSRHLSAVCKKWKRFGNGFKRTSTRYRLLLFRVSLVVTRLQENGHSSCTDGVHSAFVIARRRTVFRYQQSCQRRVSDYAG